MNINNKLALGDIKIEELTNNIIWQHVIDLVDKYFTFIRKKMLEFGYGEGATDDDLKQMSYLYAYELMVDLLKPDNKYLLDQAGFYTIFIRSLEYRRYHKKRKDGGNIRFVEDFNVLNKLYTRLETDNPVNVYAKIEETIRFICYHVLTYRQAMLFWHLYRLCDVECLCEHSFKNISSIINAATNHKVDTTTLYKRGICRIKKYMKKYDIVGAFTSSPLSEYLDYLYSLPVLTNNSDKFSHDRQEISPKVSIGEANV